jgi:F0F1-type ATP synthase assembly protein I
VKELQTGAAIVAMNKPPGRPESLGSSMSRGMAQASYGLSVAFAFVAIVIGFWWIGRQVDARVGIEPWAQVIGTLMGWILGVAAVYVLAKREQR